MLFSEALGHFMRLLVRASRQRLQGTRGIDPVELTGRLPDPIGLYVHVPFCERICAFCPYNKTLYDPGLARRYIAGLRRELDLVTPHMSSRAMTSLYIGGGSPTLLPELIEELCAVARDLGVSGEMGVEVLPGHATPKLLGRLRRAGINYVSIGVQSFDDAVLGYLGRSHDARTGRAALESALAEGFDCVDVDLVFDVVRFGVEGVLADSEQIFALGAGQLSVYPMMRFGYTPVGAHKIHDERREKQALDAICRAGARRGYQRTSVWTYNRDPSQRYTSITREFYLGLGPSGSSFLDGLFTVNSFDTATYADLLDGGRLPVVLHATMGRRSAMAYYLFWRAYEGCIEGDRFRRLFGVSLNRAVPGLLAFLRLSGSARQEGDAYVLTRRGFDLFHTVERWVTYNFIEPTWAACRSDPFPDDLRL